VAVLLIVVILVMVVVEAGTLRVLLTVVDLTLTVVYVFNSDYYRHNLSWKDNNPQGIYSYRHH
jgi:Flp pilus assembly protein TadB